MKLKKARKLRDFLMLTGFVVMLCAYIYEPLLIVGGIICCSCLIPHFLFNKCPHCGKQLGNNASKFCQHCGEALE